MAWFVVQKDGERARMVTSGELMGAIYCARAEVRVTGFATYEKAQAAVDVVDAELRALDCALRIAQRELIRIARK